MPRKKIVVISAVVLAAVVLFSSLFYLSENRLFPLTKGLEIDVLRSERYQYTTRYEANFTDGNQQVATLYIYLESITTSMPDANVAVYLTPNEKVKIDSMIIKFDSVMILSVLADLNHQPVPFIFTRNHDARIITIKDFGWYGNGGTNDFRFVFQNFGDRPNDLSISMDIFMHYKAPLQLTGLKAHADVHTFIPNGIKPTV